MKLFVGKLSTDTTELELRDAFSEFEPILDYHRPLNRETGEPRGFAFVTLVDRDKGEEAIGKLDGLNLGGRKIVVNEAEERRSSAPSPRRFVEDPMEVGPARPVDDRPIGNDGKKVRYKSI